MSPESNQSISSFPDSTEPRASSAPVPVWMLILLFILLYWGMVYFDLYGGWFSPQVYAPYKSTIELATFQPPTGGIDLQRGKQVFENVCALCHNNDGNGKPNQGPPLAGSDWVVGPPNRMIRIPLAGLSGPVVVKGETWTLSMPAMGAALPDDDLAAVLSYMRQSWGNKASPITAEQIKAIRAEIGNRPAFSADELQKIQ